MCETALRLAHFHSPEFSAARGRAIGGRSAIGQAFLATSFFFAASAPVARARERALR